MQTFRNTRTRASSVGASAAALPGSIERESRQPGECRTYAAYTLIAPLIAMAAKSIYVRRERSMNLLYGVLYSYYSSVALFWIFPFAVATVRSRRWLTR
jgi:hypothetical protein